MIPRLTPPTMIKGSALPTFNQICRLSVESDKDDEEPVPFSSLASDEIKLPQLFGANGKEQDDREGGALRQGLPRAIWLGEQHHQAKVLSSQLQIISQLFQSCKEPKKVHVVMEHFSVIDQPLLNVMNNQEGDDFDAGSMSKQESTSEGFNMSHYLTIVKLVRELGGTVWGGFPPRSWAKLISKSEDCVFDQVQKLDQERYNSSSADKREHLIPPLSEKDYRYVENVKWPHRIYLKSMFRPDKRPEILSESKDHPPLEKKGFLAAQALKDTFLSHSMASILARDPENIVVGVAGLGHCEWGYGAPERLKDMTGIDSFIIMTKPDDSGYWKALPDEFELASQWKDKQADVVVLYEWVD
jgi:uncharacterized iron-regulated protein